MPTEECSCTVVGVGVEDNNVVLLTDTNEVFNASTDVVETVTTDGQTVKNFFTTGEKKVKISKQGNEVMTISLTD